MLSREISVFSNLVSYQERETSQIPRNSNFVWSISWKLLKKTGSSLCYHTISVRTCFCACICLILLLAYLAYYCFWAMLISVSHSSIVNTLCCLFYVPGVYLKPCYVWAAFVVFYPPKLVRYLSIWLAVSVIERFFVICVS